MNYLLKLNGLLRILVNKGPFFPRDVESPLSSTSLTLSVSAGGEKGLDMKAISSPISPSAAIWIVFGALAEFERNLIRDQTNAGLSAARARGRNGGRAKKLDEKQRELAVRLYNEGQLSKAFARP